MTTWIGVDSSNLIEQCGGVGLDGALDGTDYWRHEITEIHYFILDLGGDYLLTRAKGRSNNSLDPTGVDIYVSDDGITWGTAVATNITTWQDTAVFQEVALTEKMGRYVKIVIHHTEGFMLQRQFLNWGSPMISFNIIDFGYEISPPLDPVGSGWEMLSIKGVTNYNLTDLLILYNGTYYTWLEATTDDNEEGEPLIIPWVYGWNWTNQFYTHATTINPAYGYWFYWYHHGSLYVAVAEVSIDPIICIPGTQINIY